MSRLSDTLLPVWCQNRSKNQYITIFNAGSSRNSLYFQEQNILLYSTFILNSKYDFYVRLHLTMLVNYTVRAYLRMHWQFSKTFLRGISLLSINNPFVHIKSPDAFCRCNTSEADDVEYHYTLYQSQLIFRN